jgi:hypothetical protein
MAEEKEDTKPDKQRNRIFSQTEVDRLIAQARDHERARWKTEIEKRDADIETIKNAADERINALTAEVATLTGERDTLRTEHEGLARRHDQLSTTLSELRKSSREATAAMAIREALEAAKVLPSAAHAAARLFREDLELEFGEDGTILAGTYGGQRFERLAEAASAYLTASPWFANAGSPGGSGTHAPTASGGQIGPTHQPTASEKALEGWLEGPTR